MEKLEYHGISIAQFLHQNPQLAGFENPTKIAYTSIRELVENSLDACESVIILPNITIKIKWVGTHYAITIIDNGHGVPKKHIPEAFGRVLFGSKYSNRQNRGQLGLGAKMAFIMGQISTRKPFVVASAVPNSKIVHAYTMEINTTTNKPEILKYKPLVNKNMWHGTIVKFCSKGDFQRALNTIKNYLRLTCIMCPYVRIKLIFNNEVVFKFNRATTLLPKSSKIAKFHPHGVDAETLQHLITSSKKKDKLVSTFLTRNFQRVGRKIANKFLKFSKVPDIEIGELKRNQIVKLAEAMSSFNDFISPSVNSLSPVGEEILRQGVIINFNPDHFIYSLRKGVHQGHAYIIEVAGAYGGKQIKALKKKKKNGEVILYRFANRIPLLYDTRDCLFKRVLENINLNQYRINSEEPVLVIVHICSTKVPYKTMGKEYISSDFPEISRIMRLAYGDVFREIKNFIGKKVKRELNAKRVNVLQKYLKVTSKYSAETIGKEVINVDDMFTKQKVK